MPRLDAFTRAHARDVVESLHTFDPDGPSALSWIAPEIAKLVRSDNVGVFTVRERNERMVVGSLHAVGFSVDGPRRLGERLAQIARQPSAGWSFDPARPDPRQRNRVVDSKALERLTGVSRRTYPIFDFLQEVGLSRAEQLRVLVCDGGSLLAYLGAFQPDAYTASQKTALAAVVPALQRRLTFERLVADGARKVAALDAALEAIGHPAFVVSARGTVHELNASARELLVRASSDVRRALADAIARRPSRYVFELTPLRITGGPACHLAVLRDAGESHHAAISAAAAARWGLTLRRSQVLEMVVRGMTNANIASEIGISERAVEQHVSAIFDRVGVENRAALVARVMKAEAGRPRSLLIRRTST
jgi:DNA-binding CsgD family transcriptional regulator